MICRQCGHSVCVSQFVRLEGMSCVYYLYRGVCMLCTCVSILFTSACVHGSVAEHCVYVLRNSVCRNSKVRMACKCPLECCGTLRVRVTICST